MYEIIIVSFFAIIGMILASFGNMLVFRLKSRESLLTRSHCEHCKHTLEVLDLIPIFSFLFLRGKCRYCMKIISKREVLGEIFFAAVGAMWGYLYINGNIDALEVALFWFFSLAVFVIAVSDSVYLEIPDEMQMVLTIAGLLNIATHGDILLNILNVVFASGLLLITFLITGDKKMGFGDVKLAFGLGFFLNYFYFTLAILLSSIAGVVFAIAITKGNRAKLMKYRVPYGSFLSIAALLVLLALLLLQYPPLSFSGLYL